MNKVTTMLTGTAVTLALGAGLIFGNVAFASLVADKSVENQSVIATDLSVKSDAESLNVVALRTNVGNGVFLAQSQNYSVEERMSKIPNISKEEQERRLAEKLRASGYTEEEIVKKMEEIKKAVENPIYVEGTPGANDIAVENAVDIAKSAIQEKYALTDKTLSRFYVHTGFNVANLNSPTWHIDLNPIIQSDFSEIGCYNVILDSVTGKIIEIGSAADGRG